MRNMGVLFVCGFLVLPVVAAADSADRSGYGQAKFGTATQEVSKLYPDMKALAGMENLGAAPVGGPYISRYVLRQQNVEGLAKPADVELRFWKDQLWLYIVYLGENTPENALEALTRKYGPVTGKDPKFPIWSLPLTSIVVEPKDKRYTVNDETLSKEAREWFIETLKKGRAAGMSQQSAPQPPAASTPGSTAPGDSPGAQP